MTLWEGLDAAPFYVVRNAEGQYSLWPAEQGVPAGWDPVSSTASRSACLAEIQARWTDLTPASARLPRRPTAGSRAQAARQALSGTATLTGPVSSDAVPPVHKLIEAAPGQSGSAVAMRCGDRTVTRDELLDTSRAWAGVLVGEGCGPEVPVGVLMPRGTEAITAIVAILRSGAAYVPLACSDPPARLASILRDCGQPLVVVADEMIGQLTDYAGRLIRLSDLRSAANRSAENGDGHEPALTPDSLAYIMYTSGTTGAPKGVQGTHGQLTNYALWCREAFSHRPGEWTVLHAPLSFLGSLTTIFTPLLAGWPIEVAREGSTVDDVLGIIEGLPVGLLKVTPTHLRMLLARGAERRRVARQFMIGSEPLVMSARLARWIQDQPDAVFANHYGLTETHGCFCHRFDATMPPGTTVPIGTPIRNVRAHVVGPDGTSLLAGEIGELLIAGESIGRGYHGKPALTAARWIPDRYGPPGSRLLRTGDLAVLRPDGTVELTGRADRQVKIRGHRVEPGAVERALRSQPGIADALVLPSRDGEITTLAAYLVPEDGATVDTAQVHSTAAAVLPAPSVPSRMTVLDKLPVNSNGKLDVSALPPAEPITARSSQQTGSRWTRYDLMVADVFCAALGATSLGINDDFFELGGDSLMAVNVAVELGRRLGVDDVPAPSADCGSVRAYAAIVADAVPDFQADS